jgi:hypothetical protein
MPESLGWYSAQARDCLRLAKLAATLEERDRLLDSARTWLRLADASDSDLPADPRHQQLGGGIRVEGGQHGGRHA